MLLIRLHSIRAIHRGSALWRASRGLFNVRVDLDRPQGKSDAPWLQPASQCRALSSSINIRIQQPQPHIPPLPIRVALVSVTTALCTPAFPAIGLFNLCLRVVVPEPRLRAATAGAWGTLLTYCAGTMTPALYQLAPVLLPFAVGNGIAAGIAYGVLDVVSGGPNSRVLRNPLAGVGIGAMVGLVAPPVCYGPVFWGLYGVEGVSQSMQIIFQMPFVLWTSVATGAVAGLAMYPLLYFPTNGIRAMHWTSFSGTILIGALTAAYWLYTPGENIVAPLGSYVDPKMVPLLDSILRYNTETRRLGSYSLKTGRWLGPPELCEKGRALAADVRARSRGSGGWTDTSGPTYDDRMLAWMHYNLNLIDPKNVPTHVISVRKLEEVRETEDAMLKTDGIVGFLVESSSSMVASGETYESLLELAKRMNSMNQSLVSERKLRQSIDAVAALSPAVELLFILKRQLGKLNDGMQNDGTVLVGFAKKLETEIRTKCPELLLYTSDERDCEGKSVESQLRQLSWKGRDVASAMADWEIAAAAKESKRQWRQLAFATVAFLASVGGLFLLS
jgi:hypothetical protein